jgi:hypothetical protein
MPSKNLFIPFDLGPLMLHVSAFGHSWRDDTTIHKERLTEPERSRYESSAWIQATTGVDFDPPRPTRHRQGTD